MPHTPPPVPIRRRRPGCELGGDGGEFRSDIWSEQAFFSCRALAKEWREAGAAVVHDLSDVLEHVARSDFALGCSA